MKQITKEIKLHQMIIQIIEVDKINYPIMVH